MVWIINIVSSYFKTLIGMVVVFFLTPFIISHIGMEMFGLWALIFAIVSIFGLMDFGFATAAVKYVAEHVGSGDMEGRNRILSTLFVVYSCIGLLCILIVAIVAGPASSQFDLTPAQQGYFTEIVWLLGMVVAIGFPAGLFKAALVGSGRMYIVSMVELSMLLTNAALIVWLLSDGYGLRGLAWATAATMLGTLLLLIPLAYRLLPDMHISFRLFSIDRVRSLMSFSVYAFIANVAMLVILRIDPIVVGMFMSLSAIAVYAIAVKISEYTYSLNKQFSNALMPLVSQSHGAGDLHIIRKVLMDGTRFLMGVSLPFILLLYYYAADIIVLWVGHEFDDSIPLLRVLLIAIFFSATQLNVANVLGMTGFHRFVAFSMAASAAVNLCLSVVLIQFWGLYGVALATLVAAFVIETIIMIPRACREQGISAWIFFKDGIFPAIPAVFPMLGVAFLFNLYMPTNSLMLIALEGVTSFLVYLLVFTFTGVRSHERQMVINKLRHKLG